MARALGNSKPPDGVRVSVAKEASIRLNDFELVLLVSFHISDTELDVVAAWAANQIRKILKRQKKGGTHINARTMTPTDEEVLRLMRDAIKGEKPTKQNKPSRSRTTPRQHIRKALKQLINALDRIFEEHEEVGDTDVRGQMYEAIHKGFIVTKSPYKLPAKFGMFSDEGNKLVRVALERFLAHSDIAAAFKSLKTPEARLAAFQDTSVESNEGNTCEEYFGYAEKP